MNFSDFLILADELLQPDLASAGFQRKNPGFWSRRKGDDLNAIWLQEHSVNPLFWVNLGVHYAFLPKTGTEAPLTDDYIEQPDCEFKFRLTTEPAVKDQWWPITLKAANEVSSLMGQRGLDIFDSYRLAGPISALDVKDVDADKQGMLSALTTVRACLFLARMHERLGNRDKCFEAAQKGIAIAGMAVGPKAALKDILRRCTEIK